MAKTIEEGLAEMARTMLEPEFVERARETVERGDVLEITILASPARQGSAVTMHSLVAHDRQSHGRLIRLK